MSHYCTLSPDPTDLQKYTSEPDAKKKKKNDKESYGTIPVNN